MTDLSDYLNSAYDETDASGSDTATDDAPTLILAPGAIDVRDFEQLAALRATANTEPLPFDAIADEDKLP